MYDLTILNKIYHYAMKYDIH